MSELDLRAAFDSGNVSEKNIALRRASDRITALEAENKALREGLREIIDLIVTCPDAPRAPDSLPQCIRLAAEHALATEAK